MFSSVLVATERFDIGVRYQPGPGRVLNASYRYIREQLDPTGVASQLKQIDLSGQWPFGGDSGHSLNSADRGGETG